MAKITVVGSGFVGEATGRGFQKHGNEVTFVDVSKERVQALKKEGFTAVLADEYTELNTDITMFCVPTPTKGGEIQLEHLRQAVKTFAERLKTHDEYHVAVVRSTVPPKTCRELVLPFIEKISGKKAGKDFGLCMQPEYLRQENANNDFARPWFILIGELDEKSGEALDKIYRKFDAPIERCTLEEAEFQVYVHNIYNALKVAFFNEMRLIANKEGWDADAVFRATAESCEAIWNPIYGVRDRGPFDGAGLPKDTRALLQWGDSHKYDLGILRAVVTENLKHEKVMGKNKHDSVHYLENISV
jgi:UDPglucose 6-dehydrogenase